MLVLHLNRIRTAVLLVALTVAAQIPLGNAGATEQETAAPTSAPQTRSATVEGLPSGFTAAAAGGGTTSSPVEAPIPFSMVGLELPESAVASLRTSVDGSTWTPWEATEQLLAGDDGPDAATSEAAGAADIDRFTEPVWVGEARWLQVELHGAAPADVDATFIDTMGLSGGGGVQAASTEGDGEADGEAVAATTYPAPTMPGVVSRKGWGADESLRNGSPSYAKDGVRYAVIHHTAGGNSYAGADAPAVVRGIFHYHTEVLGWNDVGYNALVDRYGNVYEGRAGGLDAAVIGAHAQGFNTGSLGVAVLGEFTSAAPPQVALDAVADVVAWTFKRHGVDASGGVVITSGGSNKYPAGEQVPMSTIFGHRDSGRTACPGDAYYAKLPAMRTAVAERVDSLPGGEPAGEPAEPSFTDISGSVHAASIEKLARAGVTGGCGGGRFCPDALVTRAQAVTLIVRAAGTPTAARSGFSDVPDGHVHAEGIDAAVAAGFITGYGDGTFRPEALVTREQLATVLAKAKGLARRPGQYFSDVPWTSNHLANVNAIGEVGLSQGCGGGRYCPYGSTTRGQMATFVARAFES